MSSKRSTKPTHGGTSVITPVTLQNVLNALEGREALSLTRRRDLRSAVRRTAFLLGEDAVRIALDLPALSVKLAAVNPGSAGLTSKTFSNIKSDFVAAVKASELTPITRSVKSPLNGDWAKLMARLRGRRARIGLSQLARHASALGIAPAQIDDAAITKFVADVRASSLHRNPRRLHKTVSLIWNEVARQTGLNLQPVMVPSFRRRAKRIAWRLFPNAFHDDVDAYLTWCGGSDVFAANARSRALAPRTLRLRRDQIHAGITALVESGIKPAEIRSLADLVSPENFKRLLRRRIETIGGCDNAFNRNLADALVSIARDWTKINADVLTELKRLAGKMPTPLSGLTAKNKKMLRVFDDPAVLQRLHKIPVRLWAEIRRENQPSFLTLARAQAALAVAILSYMPVRLQNLAALTFDVHLFMREGGARTISTLELSAVEVKNRSELAFDIPPHLAKMLLEYRNHIAPKVIGRRPEQLFVNADGTPKSQKTIGRLVTVHLKRAGIVLTPHQFRHLSAKVLLDAEPGSFETVRQLLGHKRLTTTVAAYAGIDSRRAARHHQRLVDDTLRGQ